MADNRPELFLVEGESAARAVQAACSGAHQQVLAVQGKPRNPYKCSADVVLSFSFYARILRSLGFESLQLTSGGEIPAVDPLSCRFQRILLLFDPDADGIHCAALVLLFFHRVLPSLLDAHMLFQVHPPKDRFTIQSISAAETDPRNGGSANPKTQSLLAYSEDHRIRLERELRSAGYTFQRQTFRGLASLDRQTLFQTCIAADSRKAHPLTIGDAIAAGRIFCGNVFSR